MAARAEGVRVAEGVRGFSAPIVIDAEEDTEDTNAEVRVDGIEAGGGGVPTDASELPPLEALIATTAAAAAAGGMMMETAGADLLTCACNGLV